MRNLRHPATLLSMLALLVATAGGGYAAGSLIGSKQIRDHTIQLRDLSPAAVQALRGQQGPPGTVDLAGLTRVLSDQVKVEPGQPGSAVAMCPPGQAAISGGGSGSIAGVAASVPFVPAGDTVPRGWAVVVQNDRQVTVTIQAVAVCAAP